jgi:hypothetical protein
MLCKLELSQKNDKNNKLTNKVPTIKNLLQKCEKFALCRSGILILRKMYKFVVYNPVCV